MNLMRLNRSIKFSGFIGILAAFLSAVIGCFFPVSTVFAQGSALNQIIFLTGGQIELLGTSTATFDISTLSATGGSIRIYTRSTASGGLFIASSTNNVGIGTTTPSNPLTVAGNANITGVLTVGSCVGCGGGGGGVATTSPFSAGYIPLATSSSAITNSVIFQSGANIGIGTTTPVYKLDVAGDIRSTGYMFSSTKDKKTYTLSNGAGWYRIASQGGAGRGGRIRIWGISGSNVMTDITFYVSGMGYSQGSSINILDNVHYNGNHISNIRAGTDASNNFVIDVELAGIANPTTMNVEADGNIILASSPTFNPTAPTGGVVTVSGKILGGGSSRWPYSFTTGNVGIGTTAPQAPLHVTGSVNAPMYYDSENTNYYIDPAANTGRSAIFAGSVGVGTTTPAALFTVATTTNIFNVLNSGRVGIRTSNPQQALHVAGYVRGDSGLCISTDCRTSWPAGVTGSGMESFIPLWKGGASNLENSIIYQSLNTQAIAIGIQDDNLPNALEIKEGGNIRLNGSRTNSGAIIFRLAPPSQSNNESDIAVYSDGSRILRFENATGQWNNPGDGVKIMSIDPSQNVVSIMGEPNRTYTLEVTGSINATGELCIKGFCQSSWPGGISGTGAANKVAFWTGATTLSQNTNFHWDNTNLRLGIGTATPAYNLDVVGSLRSSASALFAGSNFFDATCASIGALACGQNRLDVFGTFGVTGTSTFTVATFSGNVGIGTNTPSAGTGTGPLLHIVKGGSAVSAGLYLGTGLIVQNDPAIDADSFIAIISGDGAGGISGITFGSRANALNGEIRVNNGNGLFQIFTYGTNAINIDNLGRVVIGNTTPTPSAKFYVYGSTYLSATTTIKNHLFTSSTPPLVSSCGTGSSLNSGSNDTAGRVFIGSSVTSCTINFGRPWPSPPVCVATNNSTTTAVRATSTGTSFTLSTRLAAEFLNATVSYICIGLEGGFLNLPPGADPT